MNHIYPCHTNLFSIPVLTRTLFVGALPESYTQRDVAEIFEKYGRLGSIIVSISLKNMP